MGKEWDEKKYFISLIKDNPITRHDEERIGCDICKRKKSTEKFIGFNGNVLWICPTCYKKTIKPKQDVDG